MRILLVNVPHPAIGSRIPKEQLPPLGLLAVGGPLIDDGHEVSLIDGEFGPMPLDGLVAEAVRRARAAYWGLVTRLDILIGRVLDALEKSPYRDNTIVVMMGDNGFLFGEQFVPLCGQALRQRGDGGHLGGPAVAELALRLTLISVVGEVGCAGSRGGRRGR